MKQSKKQHGLNDLLKNNTEAKDLFLKLPENVQGMLQQNTFHINSLQDLYDSVQSMYK